jgi:hypothetical protein
MSNTYIKIPTSISFKSIIEKDYTLSSSQYVNLIMRNENFLYVKDFLKRDLQRKDLGAEVGSLNYIGQSTHYFIRTKALQAHSFIPEISTETALPIMPNSYVKMALKEGDILISKDSNIGEIVVLDKDYPNFMLSGAIYKLPVIEKKYYLLAFIKHNIFREQLDFMVPKGATIRHAKTLFLDCKIPMPNHNANNVIEFIELLTQAIINKEKLIKQRHSNILYVIEKELSDNQKNDKFNYQYPKLMDLVAHNRLDATFHSVKHHSLIFPVLNYKFGFQTLDNQGLELKSGPSLEIKILETRIDSDVYINGFYRLITPKQILNYGTLKKEEFIGTPKSIPKIKFGDILFGESGTGRTMVFLDKDTNTINNAHAHILRPIENECSLEKAITIRCIMQYYKEIGITDCLTVGGAGGHLSPSYFDRVYIPNFEESKQEEIAKLYYAETEYKTENFTLDNFLEKDNAYNKEAGIYELDKTAKRLKEILNKAIDNIVNDIEVTIKFS